MFDDIFSGLDDHYKNLADVYEKTRLDSTIDTPNVGDTVLVNSFLIGRGHPWLKTECEVMEVANTGYKIRFPDNLKINPVWISPDIVSEVIRKK